MHSTEVIVVSFVIAAGKFRRASMCSYLSSSLIGLIQDKVCELSSLYQIRAFVSCSQVSRSVGFK